MCVRNCSHQLCALLLCRALVLTTQASGLPFDRMMFEFGHFWMPFACERAGYLEVSIQLIQPEPPVSGE